MYMCILVIRENGNGNHWAQIWLEYFKVYFIFIFTSVLGARHSQTWKMESKTVLETQTDMIMMYKFCLNMYNIYIIY